MPAFRKFKVGEKVRILDDRRKSWQEREELEIVKVYEHEFRFEVGHYQTLLMANGKTYSGWWFDPAAICPW